jgi:molybdopterin synthase sulfur carrier subunit
MRVLIPSPLFSYTGGQRAVDAEGRTLAEVLQALEQRFPGMRHRIIDEQDRIRRHIRIFVGGEMAGGLDARLKDDDEVMIVAALSGG